MDVLPSVSLGHGAKALAAGARHAGLWMMAAIAMACSGEIGGGGRPDAGPITQSPDPDPPPVPPEIVTTCDDSFEPTAARSYAGKVKTLLTGRAVNAEELAAIEADPGAFRGLVASWVDSPEADEKLLRFFATAFQQDGYEGADLTDLWNAAVMQMGMFEDGTRVETLLMTSFRESFARMALEIMREGRPIDEVLTTPDLYMTTAQMIAWAIRDDHHRTDDDEVSYETLDETITSVTYQDVTPVPLSETLDPESPEFMRFYTGDRALELESCGGEYTRTIGDLPHRAFLALNGWFFSERGSCRDDRPNRAAPYLTLEDYLDFRKVRVRAPAPGEPTAKFWDVDELRASDELVIRAPQVGFFTTPTYLAAWPTNEANSARVITNQTMIVALGNGFSDETTTIPALDDALNSEHAEPGTTCYGCHVNLDPMRQFFRVSLNDHYHLQTDESVRAVPPSFAFLGEETELSGGVEDLGASLASHSRFAPAMMQKVCFFATSAECAESSAHFQAILADFRDGLDFRQMLVDLLSSPLVTGAECVEGGAGDFPSLLRQRHLCASFRERFDLDYPCGESLYWGDRDSALEQLSAVIPDDGFSRGSVKPVTITDPSLFATGALEALCTELSQDVLNDVDGTFSSDVPPDEFIAWLADGMGLPEGDPRRAAVVTELQEHEREVRAAPANAAQALQSTFMLACMSPAFSAIGF